MSDRPGPDVREAFGDRREVAIVRTPTADPPPSPPGWSSPRLVRAGDYFGTIRAHGPAGIGPCDRALINGRELPVGAPLADLIAAARPDVGPVPTPDPVGPPTGEWPRMIVVRDL